jgi:hypothetical protein
MNPQHLENEWTVLCLLRFEKVKTTELICLQSSRIMAHAPYGNEGQERSRGPLPRRRHSITCGSRCRAPSVHRTCTCTVHTVQYIQYSASISGSFKRHFLKLPIALLYSNNSQGKDFPKIRLLKFSTAALSPVPAPGWHWNQKF